MDKQLDVVFVNFNDQSTVYQDLSNKWTAIEPPTWSIILAGGCLARGYGCSILDCDAEKLSLEEAIERIRYLNPRLLTFVVYSSNPNGGTANLGGNLKLAKKIKEELPGIKIGFCGSHTSALPLDVLSYKFVDAVFPGDSFYAICSILDTDLKPESLTGINGLGYKDQFGFPQLSKGGEIVHDLNKDFPRPAFELLPFKNKPFDLYRSHVWATNMLEAPRSPYVSLYTSLGCIFKCSFCQISTINRTDYSEGITAADSNIMRFWSPEVILKWYEELIEKYNVTNIRIADEMYFLKKSHFEPILNGLIERGYGKDLISWCYARISTTKEQYLDLFRDAGIRYLAFGIESSNQRVRQEIEKGLFKEVDIRDVVNTTRKHGINVIGNYIYGLPEDDMATMQETLDLALELNTEFYNGYPASALPGSPLYYQAKQNGWKLPESYSGYSFHSYDCLPLPTKYLTAREVLKFRDEAWQKYMTNEKYLNLMESKFGLEAKNNIQKMSMVKIRRKILEDENLL